MVKQGILTAGTGKIDITPKEKCLLAGFVLRNGLSEGVLHPIFARALYFQQDDEKVLILSCEALGFNHEYVMKLRRAICEQTDIPVENIMITCTHTHSGPATMFLRELGGVNHTYLDWLIEPIIKVAMQATRDLAPVIVKTGRVEVENVSENRRAEGGPIDPELSIVKIEVPDGTHLATIVNFACHPTSLQHENMQISGDYPGYVMQSLEGMTGGVVMYLNGATGNIRPIHRNSLQAMQASGDLLVKAVKDQVNRLKSVAAPLLSCSIDHMPISYQPLQTKEAILDKAFREDGSMFYMPERTPLLIEKQHRIIDGWREEMLARFDNQQLNEAHSLEIQIIKIGTITLIGIGGELFVELGLTMKAHTNCDHLMISCYTNDNIGYIPTQEAYQHGGYEVEESFFLYNNPGMLMPSTGEQIVTKAIELINE